MTKCELRKNPPESFLKKLTHVPEFIARHLYGINVTDEKDVEAFLSPDYELHTHDSFLLKDMKKAVERIFEAMNADQKICIYSDYDADGIPAAVILHDFFKKIGFENFINYIPHRNREGFGINMGAVEKLIEQKVNLIISVDCGIADVSQIKFAQDAGIDVIVTDHHEVPGEVPSAYAVIDPKQSDCNYPEKMLCGSGVAFKLVQAMLQYGREKNKAGGESSLAARNIYFSKITEIKEGWEKWLLDMVGIATLSDMVPLVGENRVFAKYGLLVLRKSPRVGLVRLLRDARINQAYLNEDDVGFSISPKINAASRMGEPELAFKLLSTSDVVEADECVRHLTKINNERKGAVSAIVKEINKHFDKEESNAENIKPKIIVRGNPNWSPSLLGLVASSLAEKHNAPVFLWGKGEGTEFKGSCRSNGSVNVVDVMKEIPVEVMPTFGGHHMAGGFVVSDKGVFDLEIEMEKAFSKVYQKNIAEKVLTADTVFQIDNLDQDFFKTLAKLSPFGVGNEKPVLYLQETEYDRVEVFGKAREHVKIVFKNIRGREVPAIKFFDDGKIFNKLSQNEKIGGSRKINLVAIPEESFFANKKEYRMRIVEVF